MNIREFIHAKSQGRYAEITEMPHEEGGFGRLYKAIDIQRQRAEICIKVIKPNLSKDLQIKLWNDEVQALKLYHNRSGIVHLVGEQYQFGEDDPYWFIVMEYVHGKRLGASKYRIELDVEEDQAIRLIFQLCSVIYSIHQRGNYHQDIFPDNIKIQGEDLILLDLGGMREAERRSGTIIFGGEMYSPPEVSPARLRMKRFRTLRKQQMGSFETADIFSIGAILFELLMGLPFFESVEQSNQLKEYIYDYYTDPTILKNLKQEYKDALDATEGRGAAQLAAEEEQGVAEKAEILRQLNADIATELAAYEAIKQSYGLAAATAETRPVTMNTIISTQAAMDRAMKAELNFKASEIGILQARALAAQGNLTAAQNAANRAVDLQYMDAETRLRNIGLQINLLRDERISLLP